MSLELQHAKNWTLANQQELNETENHHMLWEEIIEKYVKEVGGFGLRWLRLSFGINC